MKKLLVLGMMSAVISGSAFAMPSVGDHAEYALTVNKAGQTVDGTMVYDLTAFDAAKQEYTQTTTTTVMGQDQTATAQIPVAQLLTDQSVGQILAYCAMAGGTPENVTVPAGAFDTCKLPNNTQGNTGFVWVAKATFGFVKMEQTDSTGMMASIQLKSFKAGQ